MGIPGDLILPGIESATTTDTTMNNEHLETEEREEGEIVDDFEDIISSDEELTMKKRIEELEEINLELEKIENISVVYNYDISKKDIGNNKDRFDLKNLPVSDISDNDEFYLPPPATHKVKRRPKKSSKISPSGHSSCKKSYEYEHSHRRSDKSPEAIVRSRTKSKKRDGEKVSRSRSRKKAQKAKKKIISGNISSSEEDICALNRDKLRLALKRDVKIVNKKYNFVEKVSVDKEILINKQPVVNHVINLADESDKEEKICENDMKNDKGDSDDSVSLEEQELRLIALKSAILKKAIKRKKRKETEGMKPYSPSEFVELRGSFYSPRNSVESGPMDISPIASPVYLNGDDCNRPVDMDLVSSNSSSPILVGHAGTWIPIDKIPIIRNNHQPPIIIHSPIPVNISSTSSQENTPPKKQEENKVDDINNMKIKIKSSSPEPSDEEELALRALLLSKLRTPKTDKSPNVCRSPKVEKEEHLEVSTNNLELIEKARPQITEQDTDTGLDPEALRQVLLLSMKQKSVNKTELVLKEAVRRLKNQTQSDNVISQEMELEIQQHNAQKSLTNFENNPFPRDMDYRTLKTCTDFQPHENLTSMQSLIENFHNTTLNEELNENIHHSPKIDVGNYDQYINIPENVPDCTMNKLESLEQIECNNMPCITTENGSQIFQITSKVPIVSINRSVTHDKVQKTQNLTSGNRAALKSVPILSSDEIAKQNSASVSRTELPVTLEIPPSVEINSENSMNHAGFKSIPINTLEELKNINAASANRSALKTVPIMKTIDTTSIVKAINIPKMKTKVIRTRTKVVNKPVNQSAQLKRKSITKLENSPTKKKAKIETSHLYTKNQLLKQPSRLITKIDIPTVQKMIIHLGNSDSESDEFPNDFATCIGPSAVVAHEKDYFDNASPMSLPMDSPCLSPHPNVTAAGPNDTLNPTEIKNNSTNAKKSIVNDIFQARLDEFLKNARSKVEQIKKEMPKVLTNARVAQAADSAQPITPLAVRHLPPSSQLEYRRLVNRMKILEKQKQAKTTTVKPNLEKIKVTIKNDQIMEQRAATELPAEISTVSAVGDSGIVPVVGVASAAVTTSSTSIHRIIVNDAPQFPIASNTKNTIVNTRNDAVLRKFVKTNTTSPLKLVQIGTMNKVQSNLGKDAEKGMEGLLKQPSVTSANLIQTSTTSKMFQNNLRKDVEKTAEALTKSSAIPPKLTQIDTTTNAKVQQNNLEKDAEKKTVEMFKKPIVIMPKLTQIGVSKVQSNLGKRVENRTEEVFTKPITISPRLVQGGTNKVQNNLEKNVEKRMDENNAKKVKIEVKPQEGSSREERVNKKVEADTKQAVLETKSENFNTICEKLDSNANVSGIHALEETYESEYKRNSLNLSENISKAMTLVKIAKDEKLKKLLLQSKLEQLRREMAKLEPELEQQNKVLSKIYPQILEHHRNITELKSKCVKLEKSAKVAARNIKGRNHEFQSILVYTNQKCKEFALEIKNLKDLKVSQYGNAEEMTIEERGLHNEMSSSASPARDEEHNSSINKLQQTVMSRVDLKNNGRESVDSCFKSNQSTEDFQDQTDGTLLTKSSSIDNQLAEPFEKRDALLTEIQNSSRTKMYKDTGDLACRIIRDDLQNEQKKEEEISPGIENNAAIRKIHQIDTKINSDTGQEPEVTTVQSTISNVKVLDLSVENNDDMTSVDGCSNLNEISMEEKTQVMHSSDNPNFEDIVMIQSESNLTSKDDNKTFTEFSGEVSLRTNISASNTETLEAFKSQDVQGLLQESPVTLNEKLETYSENTFREDGLDTITTNILEEFTGDVIPEEMNSMNNESNFDQSSLLVLDVCKEDSTSTTDNSSHFVMKDKLKTDEMTTIQPEEISSSTNENREETNAVDAVCPVQEESKRMEETPRIDVKNEEADRTTSKIVEYISPLVHLSSETRNFNPNGIICPFQLMGQCDDQQCKYEHLPKDTAQIYSS